MRNLVKPGNLVYESREKKAVGLRLKRLKAYEQCTFIMTTVRGDLTCNMPY